MREWRRKRRSRRRLRRMLKRHRRHTAAPVQPPRAPGVDHLIDADGELNVLTASGELIPFGAFHAALDALRDFEVHMGWLYAAELRRGVDPRDVLAEADCAGYLKARDIVRRMIEPTDASQPLVRTTASSRGRTVSRGRSARLGPSRAASRPSSRRTPAA